MFTIQHGSDRLYELYDCMKKSMSTNNILYYDTYSELWLNRILV